MSCLVLFFGSAPTFLINVVQLSRFHSSKSENNINHIKSVMKIENEFSAKLHVLLDQALEQAA